MADIRCSRLALERFVAGELRGESAKEVETHLASCALCAAELAQLKTGQEEFLRVHPFADLRAIGAMGQSSELWYERFFRMFATPVLRPVLIPVCIAALVAIVIVPFTGNKGLFDTTMGPNVRYKGSASPTLSYIYKRGAVVHESAPGDRFAPGDKLQFFYASAQAQYLTLFSIAPSGALSFYHPEERSTTCSILTGVGERLAWPVSIELDATPGDELVVALYSDHPLDTAQVHGWVAGQYSSSDGLAALEKRLRSAPPAFGSKVATLLLDKE